MCFAAELHPQLQRQSLNKAKRTVSSNARDAQYKEHTTVRRERKQNSSDLDITASAPSSELCQH